MSDTVVFSVPWFDVVARPVDGSSAPHYFLETADYVTVLALTAQGSVLLVQQYRPAVGAETLELPGGHVEDGESPEAAAKRELLEETGYEAQRVELLGTLIPDTGRLGNRLWCFYAPEASRVLSSAIRERNIQPFQCRPSDLFRRIREGHIDHALHLAVLLLALLRGCLPIQQENETSEPAGTTEPTGATK
jgi:ADP-ribose pyrophosphatase